MAEVVLRTRPVPPSERWLSGEADPFELRRRLYRPTCILWDGVTTWVLLDGHPADVTAEAAVAGLAEPSIPTPCPSSRRYRWSLRPGELAGLPDRLGTGADRSWPRSASAWSTRPSPAAAPGRPGRRPSSTTASRPIFDPTGRLNPGRSVL